MPRTAIFASIDHLDTLGSLALGSRLKRLSERLVQETAIIYRAYGLDFEPRWFPIFSYLDQHGAAAVTDLATATGVTHAAINQIASELIEVGIVQSQSDDRDGRKRLLILTDKGNELKKRLHSVWRHLHAALSDINEEIQLDLINAVLAFEKAIAKEGVLERMKNIENPEITLHKTAPQIVDFDPKFATDFARLNRAWIENYFRLEPEDLRILYNPEEIVTNGGFIFFATIGERVVGTCALVKMKEHEYELAKMAVDEAYRGLGIGKLLLVRAIEKAKDVGATEMFLETNTKLGAAVSLYKQQGFVECAPRHDSKYSRADLAMQLSFADRS